VGARTPYTWSNKNTFDRKKGGKKWNVENRIERQKETNSVKLQHMEVGVHQKLTQVWNCYSFLQQVHGSEELQMPWFSCEFLKMRTSADSSPSVLRWYLITFRYASRPPRCRCENSVKTCFFLAKLMSSRIHKQDGESGRGNMFAKKRVLRVAAHNEWADIKAETNQRRISRPSSHFIPRRLKQVE
jgi:hypothetical protein